MKLGIFGGTFNPIHKGHITASLKFYDTVRPDELLVIPDKIPPHKEFFSLSAEHRLAMVKLVYENRSIIGDRNITVSETELMREGKSYTVVTLRELYEKYGGPDMYLYTGSDMFYTLESWYCGEEILKMCSIVTCARENGELQRLSEYAARYMALYGTECIIMDHSPIVVSSTEIRRALGAENGKKNVDFTKKVLTDDVAKYIMENRLYSNE